MDRNTQEDIIDELYDYTYQINVYTRNEYNLSVFIEYQHMTEGYADGDWVMKVAMGLAKEHGLEVETIGDTDGLDLVFRDTDAIYNDPQYTQY
jgi:hypothetical protein